jgi:hypothetical protein
LNSRVKKIIEQCRHFSGKIIYFYQADDVIVSVNVAIVARLDILRG